MRHDYGTIKQLAKELGVKTTDLIALASQNDPFYTGTPGDVKAGEWFAGLWYRFDYNTAHLRRVHYQIISQDPPVSLPNGKPYENTDSCWNYLLQASKAARYLGLVDPGHIIDKKNPDPYIFEAEHDEPEIQVTGTFWDQDIQLPDFPSMPQYRLYDYIGDQRYYLEIWCEKSTMNDILLPICRQYDITLVTGTGELSITATMEAAERVKKAGKPARFFYISDFDPAGRSMPVAVARRLEWFIRDYAGVDLKLFPIVLTHEQCVSYQLPRTPIKKTEKRANRFEERFGEGATELDALEALHPGELARIITEYVMRYYDTDLNYQVWQAREGLETILDDQWHAIVAGYTDNLQALEAEYDILKAEMATRLSSLSGRIDTIRQAIRNDLEATKPDIEDYPIPEAQQGDELAGALFNSERDYLEQIGAYKEFQGKEGVFADIE